MSNASELPQGAVRQGGKEELRASILKTYLLRVRAEKGERAVRTILANAGIDPSMVDNETGWVSTQAARKALRGICEALGSVDALRRRGEWVTNAEALGTHVRMLRSAEQPVDAYVYLADNAREVTRVGSWDFELGGASAKKPAAAAKTPAAEDDAPETAAEQADAVKRLPKDKASVRAVRLVYRPRSDGYDDGDKPDPEAESLFCAAREGELSALPRIWGLAEARVSHEKCIAKGDDRCSYFVEWDLPATKNTAVLAAAGAAALSGGAIGVAGGWVAGVIGAVIAGALGAGAGKMWDRSKAEASGRAFEKNRIAALERGLDLRGEATNTALPGELTGTVLGGKYRIGKKIGSGGIGVVYAAEHTTLGHEVAVKVLRGAAARDGGEIARLRREAYIQVNIDNINVCRVHDLDQMPDGSMYVVMERLHGRSLADKLSRENIIAPGFALPVFIGVCRALAGAHKKGVVHRDLKPGNIFLCDDGTPKVLDFGMSKLTTAESLTQAGYTLGTPEYMAPEQCIGANVVAQTDIYAFGVLMYEALTGELPIIAQSRRELLDLHQRQIPVPMRQRRPDLDLPEALDQVVMKCLKKRIGDRPKSAEELEAMLAEIPTEGLPLVYERRTKRAQVASEDSGTIPALTSEPPPPME
ncbi:MAG: serine/threonine protein kinase [Labilithrix sp.]|nr:serine/threonine protein kinase [Labilithrix sp.]MCW5834017.1 serine/threonine protein kinase [Labilithrix sp.]